MARRLVFAFALFLAPASASAGPSPEDLALSEALFREGKELLKAGKFEEACPKLAESQRLDPAGGTLVTLGLCHEAAGKTATAWVVFGDALAAAQRDKRLDRIKLSRDHLWVLEKKLSYLTISLDPSSPPPAGLLVSRDSAALGLAALGTTVAVDPGKHVIVASAPGFVSASVEVVVGPSGDRKVVVVPKLEPEPPPPPKDPVVSEKPPEKIPDKPIGLPPVAPPPPKVTPEAGTRWSTGRYVAAGVAAAGVGLLGVGGYFSIRAKMQHDDALLKCPTSPCADGTGIQSNEDARGSAALATGFVAAGAAGVGAAALVWILSPRVAAAPAKKAAVQPVFLVGPFGGYAGVSGGF